MATLRLGDLAPDFTQDSTEGPIQFHKWLGDSWGVLFSHPKDFTPVCTTELGYTAKLKDEFAKRNVKVLAISVDPLKASGLQGPRVLEVVTCSRWPEREDCHLGFAERRAEVLEGLQRIHPSAERLLTFQQIADGFGDLRLIGRDARRMERPERVSCLEFHFGLIGLELHRPLPVRAL